MNHVYKHLELTGTSPISSDEAVRIAIAKASRTLRNLDWFEVTDVRGVLAADKIAHWQVTVKIGFRLDD